MAKLVLRNVRKTYASSEGVSRLVLAGIDLTVQTGDFVVLVGPSGCGKTTLLKIIAGLVLPDTGDFELSVDDRPITEPGPDRGVVFQQYHSYPWMSVFENVKFGLQFVDMPESDRRAKAEEQLRVVGLVDYRDEYPKVLSGGQQQRVAIARTLAAGPRVILMDEPFAALDAQTRETMQAELLQLQARTKATIVFVTHDIAEAAFLGNHVYVLSRMPAQITAHVDARSSRELILGALDLETIRDDQDGRLDAERGEWLRYDPHFLEIQKSLKQALEMDPHRLNETSPQGTIVPARGRDRALIDDRSKPESLADRDGELAQALRNIIESPASLKDKSATELAALVAYCSDRLRLLRMGGRSVPLVALSVIVWHSDEYKLRLDRERLLSLAFSICTDPSYIWPEWGIVLVGAILARFEGLSSAGPAMADDARRELRNQAQLRLVHLTKQIPPAPPNTVSRAAEALLAALEAGFPSGIQPVVQECWDGWTGLSGLPPLSNDDVERRVRELDRAMPAWYSDEDRAIYRLSMENRNAWIISLVDLT
jgi:NitT/TauT family transport system ATP-binding protein